MYNKNMKFSLSRKTLNSRELIRKAHGYSETSKNVEPHQEKEKGQKRVCDNLGLMGKKD